MTDVNTAVLARINKLLAVQEGRGATEAEASVAAEHVQRLLQQHNLTLAEVEASGGMTDSAPREKRHTTLRAMYTYQQTLMAAVAENFFCLHRVRQELVEDRGWGAHTKWVGDELKTFHKQNQHMLVGRAVNVTVALQTYTYLTEAMNRFCRDTGYDTRSKDGKMFLDGAATRLSERLHERRREQEAESARQRTQQMAAGNGTGRELILSDVYGSETDQNNDVLNGFPVGTTATRRRQAEERAARQEAEEARLVAEGVDPTVAFYRSHGYSEDKALKYAEDYNKSLLQTSRRRGGGRGRAHNWTRSDEAYSRKVNSPAYKSGRVAGNSIGLDSQVGAESRKRLPKN